jgi:nucleolar protein 56
MQDLKKLRELNLKETKKKIRDSVKDDVLIIQTISHLEDLNKVINILIKDLREWYSYYNPEFSKRNQEHEVFIQLILKNQDNKIKESMGGNLKKEDLKPLKDLTKQIDDLYKFKEKQEQYLESLMQKLCPNLSATAGTLIGAKLILHAGSLKNLILMPSSTVQLLGAEEALFRHIKTGARCPRHGLIVNHPLISSAPQKEHGRRARVLASKILLAAKTDYFKGKFIGDKLLKQAEDKFR